MQFTNFTKSILALLISTASVAYASPITVANRDIWDPVVTSPDASSVWVIGQQQIITWDTSNPPAEITDVVGEVRLSKGFVILDGILASNFSMLQGSVEVTVPAVVPGDDYSIILFGDSGNLSPAFSTFQSAGLLDRRDRTDRIDTRYFLAIDTL